MMLTLSPSLIQFLGSPLGNLRVLELAIGAPAAKLGGSPPGTPGKPAAAWGEPPPPANSLLMASMTPGFAAEEKR